MKISAVIIACNEEAKIADAINSVKWADEILLVDSESTDRTREIAESLGAKIIVQKWLGFSKQKQFAVDSAAYDWIFSLDADEKVSAELQNETLTLKNLAPAKIADGYKIPRLSIYMNRSIKHSGWYPDSQLRFFNRTKGSWKDVLIHESVEMKRGSKIGKMHNDILHFSVENAAHHHRMIGERYAPLAARQMFERGRKTNPFKIASAPFTTFIQTYFLKLGFLDGLPGFCIAFFAAYHAYLKHLLLYEMHQQILNTNAG